MKWLKAVGSKSTPTIRLELPCGVFVDVCEGKLWQPLPDGKFTLLGKADVRIVNALLAPLLKATATPMVADLISFAEAAQRAGLARKTLYEWKRTGKLRREHGLRAAGRSVRIEWGVFKASIDDGGFLMFVKVNRGWLVLSFKFNGERCEEYLGLRDNRDNNREADKLARELEAEMRAGTFDYARRFPNSKRLARLGLRAPTEPTLAEFAAEWLEQQRTHLTPASHNHYRVQLKNHVLPFPIAHKRLAEITDGDVSELIGTLSGVFANRNKIFANRNKIFANRNKIFANGNKQGTRTINMVVARLRTIFATAKRRRLIADDPMPYVRNLRQPKPDVDPFDLIEARALVAAAEGWERSFIGVLLFTGMRPNEALALRWEQIDWPHEVLRVRHSVAPDGRLALPKTRSSEREVEMIASVRALLHEQRARSQLKGDLVFPSAMGTPIDLDNFRARNWPRIVRRAGVRSRTLYGVRGLWTLVQAPDQRGNGSFGRGDFYHPRITHFWREISGKRW